ncbi:hypothetical protein [uncultured Bacteroides sp.]|uniref:hypothetical protein n=1 Tax=uncultured Bacteroides sp. TaxID=162156 RepID=UPI002AAB4A20|nr:hypothetical protein [uncultured Bacteroides sp.]
MISIKKKYIIVIFVMLFTNSYSQEIENKNKLAANFQFYGLPIENSGWPTGFIVSLGYDIVPYRKELIFSIEPRIGGGAFANKETEGIEENTVYRYDMQCYTMGVAPKVYLSLNSDNDAYLYLENDFSFLNSFTKIQDYNTTSTRKEYDYFHFYYSCKLGALIRYPKTNLSCWVGYTTLDFKNMLNRHLPRDRKRFSGEAVGSCLGIGFSF